MLNPQGCQYEHQFVIWSPIPDDNSDAVMATTTIYKPCQLHSNHRNDHIVIDMAGRQMAVPRN